MSERWTPGIGDPGVIGWLTVALYLLAAGACAGAARRASGNRNDAWRYWAAIAFSMLALGVNKQLDLQSLFTQLMRDDSLRHGWFAERRTLQLAFILAVAAAGAMMALLIRRRLAMLHRNIRLAAWGVCLVYTYVLIRAASFHHVDRFINAAILAARWNWIIEIGGIAIVVVAAIRGCIAEDPLAPRPAESRVNPRS